MKTGRTKDGWIQACSMGLFFTPATRKRSQRAARTRRVKEIGRVKKTQGLPLEMIRERRKAISIFCPSTMPKTRGAGEKSNLAISYLS